MKYEQRLKDNKSTIAHVEDTIISLEQVLGGTGESSIIRYLLQVIITNNRHCV